LLEDIWVWLYDREGPLGHKRPACMLLFAFLRGGGGGALTPKRAGSALVIGKIVLTMLVAAAKTNQSFMG